MTNKLLEYQSGYSLFIEKSNLILKKSWFRNKSHFNLYINHFTKKNYTWRYIKNPPATKALLPHFLSRIYIAGNTCPDERHPLPADLETSAIMNQISAFSNNINWSITELVQTTICNMKDYYYISCNISWMSTAKKEKGWELRRTRQEGNKR